MTPDPVEALIQWLKDTQVCFCDTCALTNDGMAERQIRLHAAQLIEQSHYCQKTVEGDAICGVKLDCHIHDWRADREQLIKVGQERTTCTTCNTPAELKDGEGQNIGIGVLGDSPLA